MKKCFRCHADINDHATFCPVCGAQQAYQQQNEQSTRTQSYQQSQTRQQMGTPYRQPSRSSSDGGKKGNGVLWAVVGFLAAAVIGLGGWLIYDKAISKEAPATVTADQSRVRQNNTDMPSSGEAKKKRAPVAEQPAQEQPVTHQTRQESVSTGAERMPRGAYNLTGAIDKYPITMNISITDGDVGGTYYYHSQGSNNKMTVSGYITSDRRVYLEEYAPSGENTGYFDGTFDGYNYKGSFSNYRRDSHLSFALHTY